MEDLVGRIKNSKSLLRRQGEILLFMTNVKMLTIFHHPMAKASIGDERIKLYPTKFADLTVMVTFRGESLVVKSICRHLLQND